jgi:microcystin-dependent protein
MLTQTPCFYLWGADANLAVSGGRGASAAADWAANKTLTLPDYRGRTLAGLDDMGNTPSNRLTATYFGASATTLGAAGGSESHLITTNEMAQHRHAVKLTDPGHTHTTDANKLVAGGIFPGGGGSGPVGAIVSSNTTGITIGAFDGVPSATDTVGLSLPHAIVQPTILATIYLKL